MGGQERKGKEGGEGGREAERERERERNVVPLHCLLLVCALTENGTHYTLVYQAPFLFLKVLPKG